MGLSVELYVLVDTGGTKEHWFSLYEANYTHNCAPMAREAGIYDYVWNPDESNVKTADDLIVPLAKGIALMEAEPARFAALNPENGWGSYDTFLPWLKRYLEACVENPKALICVSR